MQARNKRTIYEKVQVNLRIDPHVYQALKNFAADRGMSTQHCLEKLISKYMDEEREYYIKRSLKALEQKEVEKMYTKIKKPVI